jgi:hypothetical protein
VGKSEGVSAGGAERDRTDDPRLAKPVLSQLSYSPFGKRSSTAQPGERLDGCSSQFFHPNGPDGRSDITAGTVGHARLELVLPP